MQRSHKIRMNPNKAQEVLLRKTAGASRFAYNWALAAWNKQYEEFKEGKAEKPSVYSISRRWTVEKPEWARETNAGSQTQAILNVGAAFVNCWRKNAGRPAFKKKQDKASFYVSNSKATIKGAKVRIPNVGWISLRESLRYSGKILSYTVSHQAGQWHVSVQVEIPETDIVRSHSIVGVDVGIASIAVASDGTTCRNPKALTRKQKYLRRMQRKLARQKKGSKRRANTKLVIAKTHLRITNLRQDRIHKFTSQLAKNHGTAVIETLDVRGMQTNGVKHLRKQLADTAMREVQRQLEYKMAVVKAPQYFPSSKRCSRCGAVKSTFPCAIRTYRCERCGSVEDRDFNAARNLQMMPWVTGSKHAKSSTEEMQRETVNPSAS